MENKHVYIAINNVQAELAKEGISKSRKNAQQGYSFRGIDDIYGAISPLLAKEGLVILPHYSERNVVEKTTTKGGALFYVTVKGTFEIVDSKDGSSTTCETYGEAMDSADKATNKAMSAAYKYVCLQTFCVPTDGDNDADATTYEVKPIEQEKKSTVEDIVNGIQEKMTLGNCKAFYAKAIEQYGKETPEYKIWIKAWADRKDFLEIVQKDTQMQEDADYLNNM